MKETTWPPAVPLLQRRTFINNLLKASMGAVLTSTATAAGARTLFTINRSYTVGDIMDLILQQVPGAPFSKTVDTLKSGNREMRVTGIITTMFATVEIIQQAVKTGANFIIAHEPTFYNHTDDIAWVTPNHIVQQKQQLLQDNKICVWRLHDYLHSFVPDSVQYGVVQKAGWLPYYTPGNPVIQLPGMTLGQLAAHLKKQLGIASVRVIGNHSQRCQRIALLPGASGGQSHIALVEKEKPDVLVVGEVHEWETAEYIRDGLQLGEKTSLLVLGHSVSEEPGLQWLKDWLQPKLEGLKVQHISSGNPFIFV
ncbi:MAG TPA: Nif3-like dinuclear metal center hexameric protein [Chitinophagaceae bacterium]|nr:Nif3-like dinuclear metal center hexameric protein [Chitinophagaceae bacterium]